VHLATEYNEKNDQADIDMSNVSPQIRIRVKKMISIANLFRLKEINEAEALDSLLSTIDGFKKFT
ncbi:site-specific integrase, partial [Acinetobacter baumannii]|nr:site-specific integrase [Acinetobacter baumannii]